MLFGRFPDLETVRQTTVAFVVKLGECSKVWGSCVSRMTASGLLDVACFRNSLAESPPLGDQLNDLAVDIGTSLDDPIGARRFMPTAPLHFGTLRF